LGISINFRCSLQKLWLYCEKTVYCKKQCFLFKILFIARHYFFPSFWQYEFRVERSRHLLRLSTNQPIFWSIRWFPLHMKRTSARIGRVLLIETSANIRRGAISEEYGEWSRISHISVPKYVLMACMIWNRVLSYWRITCLCLYCGRFSFNARFNWGRY